jgi:hypothetical protein
MSDFDDLGVVGKPALPSLLKFQTCAKASLGSRDMVPQTEVAKVFFHVRGSFSNRDSGLTEKALDDLRVVYYS